MNAIEVKNLYFSYVIDGNLSPILKGISFDISKGELVAIQGPSGSGKSTLLYLLGLLSQPQKGLIRLLERDVTKLNKTELAQMRNRYIGFIFQQFHLLPRMTVLENILLPTYYKAETGEEKIDETVRAIELAQLVGLEHRLHHLPNQLSGGQQQRVAICRALITDAEIILADEPTGNLDPTSAQNILELLKDLNKNLKKTIVIITHDNEVAKKCDRLILLNDGRLVDSKEECPTEKLLANDNQKTEVEKSLVPTSRNSSPYTSLKIKWSRFFKAVKDIFPFALMNLRRQKTRTGLTMVGIGIGVAAVLSMITLGQYTKRKILSGYAEMGVNTLLFNGVPNWGLRATDMVHSPFRFFNWEKEISSLPKIFPEIIRLSPILDGNRISLNFGGRSIDQEAKIQGINENGLIILRRKMFLGRNFSQVEMEEKSGVCIIGYEIAQRLFFDSEPLGQVLRLTESGSSYSCRVIGVLSRVVSNKDDLRPNLQVFIPYTFFQAQARSWWSSQLKQILIQLNHESDVEKVGRGLKAFFEQKYGSSGKFSVDSDSVLIAQMKQFLTLFTLLLSSVAFITLVVGGIGITNMMLVSISERLREIGLRKALGSTDREVLVQFLIESMIICGLAGGVGLFVGTFFYHFAIWLTTKFVDKMTFEWTIDPWALCLSVLSIILVGLVSGIFPALKAEKLQVIDALRSE